MHKEHGHIVQACPEASSHHHTTHACAHIHVATPWAPFISPPAIAGVDTVEDGPLSKHKYNKVRSIIIISSSSITTTTAPAALLVLQVPHLLLLASLRTCVPPLVTAHTPCYLDSADA